MKRQTLFGLIGVLTVLGIIVSACAVPSAQVVEKVVTQVVKEEVKVVETQVVEVVETAASKPKTRILGLSLNQKTDTCQLKIQEGAQQAADERSISLEVRFAELDPNIQSNQVKELGSMTDALLVFPVVPDNEQFVSSIKSVSVPIIDLVYRFPVDKPLSYITWGYPSLPWDKFCYEVGYRAVNMAVDYLANGPEPPTIVRIPDIVLPDPVVGAVVFPPPSGDTQVKAQTDLVGAMENSGIPVNNYDTSSVVVYPLPIPERVDYDAYAAPVNGSFDKFPTDTFLGVYWDAADNCGNGKEVVYQVMFQGTPKTDSFSAILEGKNAKGDVVYCNKGPGETFYADQPTSISGTVMFFGQINPCILCGCCDKGCGCLICWK